MSFFGGDISSRTGNTGTTKTWIDNFDAQDLTPYSGDTADFSFTTSPLKQGSHALQNTAGSGRSTIQAQSGLDNQITYPSRFGAWVLASENSGTAGIVYGAADRQNCYVASVDYENEQVTSTKYDGGSFNFAAGTGSGFAMGTGIWYWMEATWDDGTYESSGANYHVVRMYDQPGGNLLDSVSGSDSTISNTNVGTGVNASGNQSGSDPLYIDGMELLESV